MSIRGRLLLVTGAVLVLLVAGFVTVDRLVLLGSFLDLEKNEVTRDGERLSSAIADEAKRMQATDRDWAYWDDAARFVDGTLPEFAADNLSDSSIVNLNVGFMIFADVRGSIKAFKLVDLESGRGEDPLPGFAGEFALGGKLLAPVTAGISGVIGVGSGAAIVSALPILNSQEEGPPHGVLVVGIMLDNREIQALAERTHLSVAPVVLGDPSVAGMFTAGGGSGMEMTIRPVDGGTLYGYLPVRDVQGRLAIILRLTMPREILAEGLRTTVFSLLAFGVMGLAIYASIHLYLGYVVLARLSRISGFMSRLGTGDPLTGRLAVAGSDELPGLARTVNGLLDTVEKTNDGLRIATAEAVAANSTKTEFLANMTHELRTPLNHILGFTELVVDGTAGPITSMQREYLGDVLSSGRHLLSLINDIIDISKVEAGRLELEAARVSVKGLLEAAIRMVTEKAAKHGIDLSLDAGGAPLSIVADERKIKQVLFNLLSNAVKYTADGGRVRVSVTCFPEQAMMEVTVADTGIGISAADQDRLFTPYTRGRGNAVGQREGTGLGLALSRRLVELHGGKIWAESEGPGGGKHLPIRASPGARCTGRGEGWCRMMSGQKILVIDDDGLNRKLLRNLLAVGSYEVLEASDAETGIRIARETMPACVLMDVRLPGMDGIAATRLMKADPALARIPVVAVTAAAMSGDERRALDAGCDGYVAKPIDTRAFLGNIRHFLQTTPGAAPTAAPRVLVVDDEPSARLLFSTWLKLEGFQPIEASSGTEAIALAHREDPDLVLLDVIIPDIDGFEVARRLKGSLQTLAIPIILVTGLSDGASRARGAECGADEFLTKPIDRVELIVRMRSMLRLKRANERLARAAQAEDLTGTARVAGAPGGRGNGQTLVVLAERDGAVAGALEGALDPAACCVLRAGTAEEVLEYLGGQDVDVLLLGMLADGAAGARELSSLLKEEEKTRNVQIIVVSGSNSAGARIAALESGADDYCALPLAREELAVRVRQHAMRKARLDMLLAGYRTAMNAAASDGLTGLANNKELKRLLDLEIRRARRHGSQGALLILDIDDFKKKNDSFGHLAGDRLLAELAQVVKAGIRDIDVAARYGGEEFAVLLPHTDAAGAAVVAERLRAAVAGHRFLDGALAPDATVTVSVGTAYFPEETAGVDDLIGRADSMLYQAKREGKNRVCAPAAPDKA